MPLKLRRAVLVPHDFFGASPRFTYRLMIFIVVAKSS